MKRIDLKNHLINAGYNGDMRKFTRLYCENRISYIKAKEYYDKGAEAANKATSGTD